MKDRKIILAPEPHKIWAIFPTILNGYETVIIDKDDYEKSIEKIGYSRYHTIIANNLKFFRDEGLLEIIDYKKILEPEWRKKVFIASKKSNSDISKDIRLDLLRKAYKEYLHTSEIKLNFLTDNIEEVKNHAVLIENLKNEITKLKNPKTQTEACYSNLNKQVFNQYLWKSSASLILANNYNNGKSKLTIYDNPEYSDFTKHLLYSSTIKPQSIDELEFKKQFYRRIISKLTDIATPYIKLQNEKEIVVFMKDRSDYHNLRKLLSHLEDLYLTFDEELIDYGENAAIKELEIVISYLSQEIENIKVKKQKRWIPLSIFGGKLDKLKPLYNNERTNYLNAISNTEYQFGNSHAWIFALLRLFDNKSKYRAEKTISKFRNKKHVNPKWWITGNENLPWYVMK